MIRCPNSGITNSSFQIFSIFYLGYIIDLTSLSWAFYIYLLPAISSISFVFVHDSSSFLEDTTSIFLLPIYHFPFVRYVQPIAISTMPLSSLYLLLLFLFLFHCFESYLVEKPQHGEMARCLVCNRYY